MKFEGEHGVVAHFLMDGRARRLAAGTLRHYGICLAFLVKFLQEKFSIADVEKVTVMHLRQAVESLLNNPVENGSHALQGTTLAVSTVRSYIVVWKAFFNWCYKEELLEKNPVSRLTAPRPEKKVTATFTVEHLYKMLSAFDLGTDEGLRDYIILLLLLDTGMRLCEISALQVSDVHDSYVKVYGKGRKERDRCSPRT